jgi:hypothetical protein
LTGLDFQHPEEIQGVAGAQFDATAAAANCAAPLCSLALIFAFQRFLLYSGA